MTVKDQEQKLKAARKKKPLSAAERQRKRRRSLRRRGLIKMEIWVPPWTRNDVRNFEAGLAARELSEKVPGVKIIEKGKIMTQQTTQGLMDALGASADVENGELSLQMLEGTDPLIMAVVGDLDEFPVMLSVGEAQILAIVTLWNASEVASEQRSQLHEFMLRASLPIPLSAFSIMDDNYVLFGALSINSSSDDVLEEIFTLANNALDAVEGCSEYLTKAA